MKIGDALLAAFFEGGKTIRRMEWPVEDYILSDGAEGGTIWYYDANEDELTAGYKLGFHDLVAGDWEILP